MKSFRQFCAENYQLDEKNKVIKKLERRQKDMILSQKKDQSQKVNKEPEQL